MAEVKTRPVLTVDDIVSAIHAGEFDMDERAQINQAIRDRRELEGAQRRREAKAALRKGMRCRIREDVGGVMHKRDHHLLGVEIGTVHKVNRTKIVVEVGDGIFGYSEGTQVNVPAGWLEPVE